MKNIKDLVKLFVADAKRIAKKKGEDPKLVIGDSRDDFRFLSDGWWAVDCQYLLKYGLCNENKQELLEELENKKVVLVEREMSDFFFKGKDKGFLTKEKIQELGWNKLKITNIGILPFDDEDEMWAGRVFCSRDYFVAVDEYLYRLLLSLFPAFDLQFYQSDPKSPILFVSEGIVLSNVMPVMPDYETLDKNCKEIKMVAKRVLKMDKQEKRYFVS